MKCRICACECPPGARICRDCTAARKRAFAATVTQPLLATAGAPSVGQRFAPRPAKPRPAKPRPVSRGAAVSPARSEATIAASAADQTAPPSRLGVQWLLLGLAVVAAIVYLLVRTLLPSNGHAPADVATVGDAAGGVSASAAGGANVSPAKSTSMVAAQPLEAAARAAAAGASPLGANRDSAVAAKNAAPKGGRKPAAKVESKALPVEPPAAPKAEPAPAPQPPPPRAAEVPRDPWQTMNEGLSRCAREDWLSRGACEQRLRLQYCPNHWGSVPQCPIGPATDHGQ